MNATRLRVLAVVMLSVGLVTNASADLAFRIAGAPKDELRVSVTAATDGTSQWQRDLRLVIADAGGAPTDGLRAQMDVLETDAGVQARGVTAALEPPPDRLVAGTAVLLHLTAAFPSPGTYRGELVLARGDAARTVFLEVIVAAATTPPVPPAPLSHVGVATVAVSGDAPARLTLDIRNTGANATRLLLAEARVLGATRVDKVDAPTEKLHTTGVSAEFRRAIDQAVASPDVTIPPHSIEAITVHLLGLDEPGIYQAQLLVPVEGHQPIQVPATVFRRSSMWWAALWIALGALLACAVRWWTSGGQRRLALRRRIAELRNRIRAARADAVEPPHLAAAMALLAELDDRERDVRRSQPVEPVETTVHRIALRALLLEDIVATTREVIRLPLEKQAEPRRSLEHALAVARIDPGEDQKITDQRTAIAKLAVEALWRDDLEAAVTAIDAQATMQARAAGDELRTALATQVQRPLLEVRELLRVHRLAESAARITSIQAAFLTLATNDLARRLDAAPPAGADEVAWPRMVNEARQLLRDVDAQPDWPRRNEVFRLAQRRYFAEAVRALVRDARDAATSAGEATARRLASVADELDATVVRDVDAAAAIYAARRDEVADLRRPRVQRAPVGSQVETRTMPPAVGPVTLTALVGREARAPSSPAQLEHVAAWTDVLVFIAVLVVAIASGVQTLWVRDLSWGSGASRLTAFLWGAGIGAVGDSFAGLIGLRERIGAAKS